ncbi:TWiK family of potassium channels protein 7-like [Bacillus rossius redtenbacheri]|uniref:TWiK family of potassium channels protein 7-like n=1 Tax=Bacillus rossius redtenbacheri TaxID=93214 RepID=UPI002FDD93FC
MLSDGRASPPYSDYHFKPAAHKPAPPEDQACCRLRCCAQLPRKQRRRSCSCPSGAAASLLSSLGVCALVLAYTALGAFTFMAVEGGLKQAPPPARHAALGEDLRSKTVEKLWSITEDLNILYKDNWTRLAAQEVLKFQDTLVKNLKGHVSGGAVVLRNNGFASGGGAAVYYNHQHHRWSFSSSFLYSLTLITTIGYGSVAPRTPWGKIITIVYALVGIPLMLVYLSTVGDVLARHFRRMYGRLCGGGGGGRNKGAAAKLKLPPAAISTTSESYLSSGYPSSASKSHNSVSSDGPALKVHHIPRNITGDSLRDEATKLDCGGDILASSASSSTGLESNSRHHRHLRPHDEAFYPEAVRVPISLCLLIILLYICAGAFLFNKLENWTFLEGSYFCFTSLGTIGFGDLIPGLYHSYQLQYQLSGSAESTAEQASVFASSAYILVGMALIAMCFNLVQDEVVIIVRRLGSFFGVSSFAGSNPRGNGDDEDIVIDVIDGEGIAMAVVSSSATSS